MNCSIIENLLPEYKVGRLDENNMKMVADHLENCSSCRNELSGIEELLHFTGQTVSSPIEEPEGFFETIWPSLYQRIQIEGLNNQAASVLDYFKIIPQILRPRAVQLANIALIFIVSIWLYSSYEASNSDATSFIQQKIAESFSPGTNSSVTEKINKGQNVLVGAMTFGLGTSENPVEDLKELFDPEKQSEMYDAVTDFLADIVIKIS